MKTKTFLTAIAFLVVSTSVFAQSLSEIMSDTSLNYKEKIKKIHDPTIRALEFASEKEQKFYHRWNWFWSTRTDKNGDMKVMYKALQKYIKESEKDDKKSALLKSATWQNVGPFNSTLSSKGEIGRAECIWSDPDDSDIILIGGHGHSIWKTTNGGTNWTDIGSPSMIGGVTDIAVHPTNDNIIYVTTGVHTSGFEGKHYATGIWKTTNGGSTWSTRNGSLNMHAMYIHKIIISPYNTNTLFALSDYAVYKSTDAGVNWNLTLSAGTNQNFHDIVFDPLSAGSYVYVAGDNCFYYTSTLGGYWNNMSSTVGPSNKTWRFAIDCNTSHKLFGYYRNYSDDIDQILVSSAQSISWTRYSISNAPSTNANIDINLRALSNGYIFVGAIEARRFYYNGSSVSSGIDLANLHHDCRNFAFPNGDHSLVYAVTDGGVSKNTSTNGTSFTQINGDLALNECYDVAIYENDANMFLTGLHDNGTKLKTNTVNWTHKRGGDGGISAIDPNNSNRMYSTSNRYFGRSTDQGDNWSSTLVLGSYNTPFMIKPGSSSILFAADFYSSKARLVKSTDYGVNFDTEVANEWGTAKAFDISPSNTNYMLFATFNQWGSDLGHLKRTTNGGTTWSHVETGLGDIIDTEIVTDICYDRTTSSKAWICFGGFSTGKRVYKSTNYGYSWTNISNGLPALPVNALVYDDERNVMYAGTDVGVYFLPDGNSTWYPMGYGMPRVIVTSLKINYTHDKLVAATYGTGIWTYDLAAKSGHLSESESNNNAIINENRSIEKQDINNLTKSNITIYPNPVSGTSEIKIKTELENYKLSIYSIDGKKVKSFSNEDSNIRIKNSDFEEGVYIIKLEIDNGIVTTEKMIIQK